MCNTSSHTSTVPIPVSGFDVPPESDQQDGDDEEAVDEPESEPYIKLAQPSSIIGMTDFTLTNELSDCHCQHETLSLLTLPIAFNSLSFPNSFPITWLTIQSFGIRPQVEIWRGSLASS